MRQMVLKDVFPERIKTNKFLTIHQILVRTIQGQEGSIEITRKSPTHWNIISHALYSWRGEMKLNEEKM